MYYIIYGLLSKYLPDELINLIIFKYNGLKHPISHSCFNVKENAKQVNEEHIYYIWNQRKKNIFTDDAFRCFYKLGIGNNIEFVTDRKNRICFNKINKDIDKCNYFEKYGLIHYFDNTWFFPTYCSKDLLISEVSKNIDYKLDFDKYSRNELINLYFKL